MSVSIKLVFICIIFLPLLAKSKGLTPMFGQTESIQLPKPRLESNVSVEQALQSRRSIRDYSNDPISLSNLSQLLWAAQGITDNTGLRTAPSAGALYPLEIYVAVGNVIDLDVGVYHYHSARHSLTKLFNTDIREAISDAALNQRWMRQSAAILIFSSIEKRTTRKYGKRGVRYIHIEVGHAAQNIFLQAEALNLGAAVVGAFNDEMLKQLLQLNKGEKVVYLMPVGRPK